MGSRCSGGTGASMRIAFIRHAAAIGDRLSAEALPHIETLRGEFERRGFRPTIAIYSTAKRAADTARILAPGAEEFPMTLLYRFGPFEMFRGQADSILRRVLSLITEGADALVVSYDSLSAVLAHRLVELRGGATDWVEVRRTFRSLPPATGFLVEGKISTAIPSHS